MKGDYLMIPSNKKYAGIFRLLILMAALTVATMCLTMGTVAKYAIRDSVQDSARVAKFGVEIEATDKSTFKTEYSSTDNSITVKSSNGDKIVAPGTADEGGLSFSISGKPEVATKISISLDAKEDIFLKMKKNGEDFYYRPLVFSFVKNGTVVAQGDLQTVVDAINAYSSKAYYDAYESVGNNYSLTWKWDFSESPVVDSWDTKLGDLAAGVIPTGYVNGENYSVDIAYSVTISVYQVE